MKGTANISEIEESMAMLLTPSVVVKQNTADNINQAIESLNKAAEIFENMKLFVVAEATTQLLEQLTKSIK